MLNIPERDKQLILDQLEPLSEEGNVGIKKIEECIRKYFVHSDLYSEVQKKSNDKSAINVLVLDNDKIFNGISVKRDINIWYGSPKDGVSIEESRLFDYMITSIDQGPQKIRELTKLLKDEGYILILLDPRTSQLDRGELFSAFNDESTEIKLYPVTNRFRLPRYSYMVLSTSKPTYYVDPLEDQLEREPMISYIMDVISAVAEANATKKEHYMFEKWKNVSIAIDGSLGSGKTFMLHKLQKALEEKALEEKVSEEEASEEKALEKKVLVEKEANQVIFFNFNCRKYDYYEEPLMAFLSFMLEQTISRSQTKDASVAQYWNDRSDQFLECIKSLMKLSDYYKKYTDLVDFAKETNKLLNIIPNSDKANNELAEKEIAAIDSFYSIRSVIQKVSSELEYMALEKTVVFVVDELDRCLPEYAIKLLERLHHLFTNVNNVVVILAVDKAQLHNTVTQIYGDKVDVTKYLRKFSDMTLRLDKGKIKETILDKYQSFIAESFSYDNDKDTLGEVKKDIISLFQSANLEVRTQERLMRMITMANRRICNERKNGYRMHLYFWYYEVLYALIRLKFQESKCEMTDEDKLLFWMCLDEKVKKKAEKRLQKVLGISLYRHLMQLKLECEGCGCDSSYIGSITNFVGFPISLIVLTAHVE